MDGSDTIDRDHLSVLTGALVLGLALARFLEAPIRSLGTMVLGSRLQLNLSATTLTLLLLAGMAVTATESLIRSHPLARRGELQRSYHFWIVPGLLVLGLGSWLANIESLGAWTAGLLAGALLIPLALASEYQAVDRPASPGEAWSWLQLALILLAAVLLFTRIYDLDARTLLSGSAVFLVSALLAARWFWETAGAARSAFLYGSVVGLLLAQLTWAVNYWPLSSPQGGLILLLAFYVIAGLIYQVLRGRLNRRVALEYLVVALFGLIFAVLGLR